MRGGHSSRLVQLTLHSAWDRTTGLDHFSILSTSGLVLWSKSFTPSTSPIDDLIKHALIEQRHTQSQHSSISSYTHDSYALFWTLANDLQLVFVVAYQRILHLSYVDELLARIKAEFIARYEETIVALRGTWSGKELGTAGAQVKLMLGKGKKGWDNLFPGWDDIFKTILRELEKSAAKNKTKARVILQDEQQPNSSDVSEAQTPALSEAEPGLDAQAIARNIAALKARQKAAGKGKAGKVAKGVETDTGSESDSRTTTPTKKAATKWADSKVSAADLAAYDYSTPPVDGALSTPLKSLVSSTSLGTRSDAGSYSVADFSATPSKPTSAPKSAFSTFLSSLSRSPKPMTKETLAPALNAMQDHLMAKNVAADIAKQVVSGVGVTLEGKKVSGNAIVREVRDATEEVLRKVLTPKMGQDLLVEIGRKKAAESKGAGSKGKLFTPYSITFVGVNGVGKSTNLSKIAFWLLQNDLRVLIAACDTFRSGAVEQLRVHVGNLGRLGEEMGGKKGKMVELYERGYGKDAAGIAKDALAYGKENGFDVVLIDTAGRMQDNEPLMRALAKLVTVNNPDKIVFVGEALVGNEAVDQLSKFDRSLKDFGGGRNARGIDGMILTKFDTIDDKVGAALSMTYVTGQPILFVGTGQTYSDLRALRVAHIVQALLQD